MSSSPLSDQSIEFAINIINYHKWLSQEKKEYVLSKQILRSGTSIGANIHEANFAVSKADFIAKMQIALKEVAETEYWLIVLEQTGFLSDNYLFLKSKCSAIKKMLISTLKTSKKSE